jgi:hypothetical protein
LLLLVLGNLLKVISCHGCDDLVINDLPANLVIEGGNLGLEYLLVDDASGVVATDPTCFGHFMVHGKSVCLGTCFSAGFVVRSMAGLFKKHNLAFCTFYMFLLSHGDTVLNI